MSDLILALIVLAAAVIGGLIGGAYVAVAMTRYLDDALLNIHNDLDPEDPPT